MEAFDEFPLPPAWVTETLREGVVIPAHPLALTDEGHLDVRRQRGLTRYYHAAGAGGLAVGVHTTQFSIRNPEHDLLEPVLRLAQQTATGLDQKHDRNTVLIAGICGETEQAVREARLSRDLGYHVGMISLASLAGATDCELISHCQVVAKEIPIFGFYLQPAVGGRILSFEFWRRLASIPNLVGIKLAPFDRYKTLDVVRGVAESGRSNDIVLYTGNDDSIVVDLLTPYSFDVDGEKVSLRIAGGLLGHWACWTERAVALLNLCKQARRRQQIPADLMTTAAAITDCNAALFDSANGYAGCIAGIQSVLHQQGLLSTARCLDAGESLSPGQQQEIDRVRAAYPEWIDDDFVAEHLDEWLS